MGGWVVSARTNPRAKQLFKTFSSSKFSLALILLKTEQRTVAAEERFLAKHGRLNPYIYLYPLPKSPEMTVNKYNTQIYNDNEMGERRAADEQH